MIFLHFAKNFRNEEPESPVFSRFSYLRYHFLRFFQVLYHKTEIIERDSCRKIIKKISWVDFHRYEDWLTLKFIK